jgi:hypothetical protein
MGAGLAEEAGAGGHPSAVGATSPSEERFGAAGPPGGDLAAGDIVDRAAADFGNCGNFPLGELAGFEETLDEEDLFDGKHDLGSQRREFRAVLSVNRNISNARGSSIRLYSTSLPVF